MNPSRFSVAPTLTSFHSLCSVCRVESTGSGHGDPDGCGREPIKTWAARRESARYVGRSRCSGRSVAVMGDRALRASWRVAMAEKGEAKKTQGESSLISYL